MRTTLEVSVNWNTELFESKFCYCCFEGHICHMACLKDSTLCMWNIGWLRSHHTTELDISFNDIFTHQTFISGVTTCVSHSHNSAYLPVKNNVHENP